MRAGVLGAGGAYRRRAQWHAMILTQSHTVWTWAIFLTGPGQTSLVLRQVQLHRFDTVLVSIHMPATTYLTQGCSHAAAAAAAAGYSSRLQQVIMSICRSSGSGSGIHISGGSGGGSGPHAEAPWRPESVLRFLLTKCLMAHMLQASACEQAGHGAPNNGTDLDVHMGRCMLLGSQTASNSCHTGRGYWQAIDPDRGGVGAWPGQGEQQQLVSGRRSHRLCCWRMLQPHLFGPAVLPPPKGLLWGVRETAASKHSTGWLCRICPRTAPAVSAFISGQTLALGAAQETGTLAVLVSAYNQSQPVSL